MLEQGEKYAQLYKTQDKIIDLVIKNNLGFYLTGGTALQRFYFNEYRYSEDLDFFLLDNGTHNKDSKDFQYFIEALDSNSIEYKLNVSSPYFNQIIIKENNLKIDLINDYVYHEKDFLKLKNGLYVDSIQNIFANKLETSMSRNEARDIFDIYIILKNTNINVDKSFDLLTKKSNLEPKTIVNFLLQIELTQINYKNIQVKNENILNDFFENFHQIIAKNFSERQNNKIDFISKFNKFIDNKKDQNKEDKSIYRDR